MKGSFGLAAIAWFVCSGAAIGQAIAPAAHVSEQDRSPAVAKIADFAKASGMKTLVYAEIDDARNGQPIIEILVIGQLPGSNKLVTYKGGQLSAFMQAISSEATASGKDGWRRIAVVVDKGTVSVERGPRPGPIEGFGPRAKIEVDHAFPGLSLS